MLTGWPGQLAGEEFLVGLDRLRANEAGQQVTPVPGLAASTATGLARRFTPEHWRGAEAGLARRPPGWRACARRSRRLSWRKGR